MSYFSHDRVEVAALIPSGLSSSTILEVGCGEGHFSNNICAFDEYWGVEPFSVASKIAAKKLSKVFNSGYFEAESNLPNDYFDLIVCNDVIEHIVDTNSFLRSLHRKLKPSGLLIGSIPNIRYWSVLTKLIAWKDWKYEDEGVLDKTHVRFFTERSMRRVFVENSYCVEDMFGINKLGLSCKSIPDFCRTGMAQAASVVLGSDVLYMQFAFRLSHAK
jgi:2-polyprenyl-3-methyl-5-hydroxy-6-metoxy-1,4-benzoquinol methylase